jgi:hypothetical protein
MKTQNEKYENTKAAALLGHIVKSVVKQVPQPKPVKEVKR